MFCVVIIYNIFVGNVDYRKYVLCGYEKYSPTSEQKKTLNKSIQIFFVLIGEQKHCFNSNIIAVLEN